MGLFTRKPLVCPFCSTEVVTDKSDPTGLAHFLGHLEDADASSTRLRLQCGCPEAVYDAMGNFPAEVAEHLRRRHQVRV